MDPLLIFILVMTVGVLPLSYLVYWLRYRGTIIFKTAFAIMISTYIVSIAAYLVGSMGINHIVWYIPVGYAALLIGNVVFKRFVQKPVKSTTEVLNVISEGNLEVEIDEHLKERKDETGAMNQSLSKMLNNLRETAEFARQIGEGNLDYKIELLGKNDHLRTVLLEMRDKLKEAAELEERKHNEEERSRWSTEGLAKLNDMLRQQDKLTELSYKVISFLVNYLEANQGGLFVRNTDDDEELIYELQAAYAYNRRKYLKRNFKEGESLIGTVAIEKETMYMTEIPQDYIQITSGLGDANPEALLIVPMKIEEEVYGIIEIASFHKLQQYQIDFVEQASLSIASTLHSSETNRKTRELLEKTQQQAEEMSAQEEEMRQNMEELQATQEESSRKTQEYERELEEANKKNEELEKKLRDALSEIEKLRKNK